MTKTFDVTIKDVVTEARRRMAYLADRNPSLQGRWEEVVTTDTDDKTNNRALTACIHEANVLLADEGFRAVKSADGSIYSATLTLPDNEDVDAVTVQFLLEEALKEAVVINWLTIVDARLVEAEQQPAEKIKEIMVHLTNRKPVERVTVEVAENTVEVEYTA